MVADARSLHRTELIAEHLVFAELQRRPIDGGCLAVLCQGQQRQTDAGQLVVLPR